MKRFKNIDHTIIRNFCHQKHPECSYLNFPYYLMGLFKIILRSFITMHDTYSVGNTKAI